MKPVLGWTTMASGIQWNTNSRSLFIRVKLRPDSLSEAGIFEWNSACRIGSWWQSYWQLPRRSIKLGDKAKRGWYLRHLWSNGHLPCTSSFALIRISRQYQGDVGAMNSGRPRANAWVISHYLEGAPTPPIFSKPYFTTFSTCRIGIQAQLTTPNIFCNTPKYHNGKLFFETRVQKGKLICCPNRHSLWSSRRPRQNTENQ